MNEFDIKAAGWDLNPVNVERSMAVVEGIKKHLPLNSNMRALEFGAGTGIASFLLEDYLNSIVMVDSSSEMVRIMNQKISSAGVENLKAVLFDLEKDEWKDGKFDLIMTQMVLHHVGDIKSILRKFKSLLNPGGYLAIADLYAEDGSFHGDGFKGHNGFDTKELSSDIEEAGFSILSEEKCFEMKK
jgi:2-polyprenyl-3-methyl-5-hydroxy-6-metoxy-1,4-benzoquinol methylase